VADELLVGGSALTLFSTGENGRRLWTRNTANPVKFAALSPDGSFIATSGWHDRLVKIWRRLYYSEENERFDVSYLPHTSAVTELRWHGRRDPEYHAEAILYTTSADCMLKVWAAIDPHGLQALQLWAEMDLTKCMLPEIEQEEENARRKYLFIIDNWEYEALVERVTHRSSNTEKDQETLKKLVDVAYRDPDICVVLDDLGNMSAWGLERVGCKARQANDVFKIAQIPGVDVNALTDVERSRNYATCLNFGGLGDGCEVNLLINFFDGRLQWLTCPIDRLFYAEQGSTSFTTEAVLTGHAEVIEGLSTDASRTALVSRSASTEVVLWKLRGSTSSDLQRVGYVAISSGVRLVRPIASGKYALLVDEKEISLWDTRRYMAIQLSSQRLPANFEVVDCLVRNDNSFKGTCEVLLVSDNLSGVLFELSADSQGQPEYIERIRNVEPIGMSQACQFNLLDGHGSTRQSRALSVSRSGTLALWCLESEADREVASWKQTTIIDTGIKDSSILSASTTSKTVLCSADRTVVTVWNVHDAKLEMTEQFENHETVNHVRWTTSPSGSPVLALVLTHKVIIYAQLPYDLNRDGSPDAWLRLRVIDITELTTLPISDFIWLAGGDLVMSAGNQMFAYENKIDRETAHGLGLPAAAGSGHKLFKVVSAMDCGLPVFHPQYLRQLLLGGLTEFMHQVLGSLHSALKYFSEGDKLDSSLGIDFVHSPLGANNLKRANDEDERMTENIANELQDRLAGLRLPYLANTQRDELIGIVKSVGASQKQQRSVDLFGYRYLVMSHDHFRQSGKPDNDATMQLSWREIVLAYHSSSQEVLIDMTSRHYKGRLLWKDARECGIFMWMTDLAAVVRLRVAHHSIILISLAATSIRKYRTE
jgi:WD40 repeat protein